jgi:membrane protease YdiL (CAAX protease family)
VILSSAIFGLGHACQGWTGIAKTTAAGLVMALLAVGSGSLFIPMLLHAIGDLTSGHMMGRATRSHSLEYGA